MDNTIKLPDGRTLGYECLGDPKGRPLFFFHGTPGSRKVVTAEEEIARMDGVRLILPERPGYGLSTPRPDRTLLNWAEDVAALADHLGYETFAVSGISGGGPHALACAHEMPNRVELALLLASPSPANFPGALKGMQIGNKIGAILGGFAPGLARWLAGQNAAAFAKNPDFLIDATIKALCQPDQEIMASPGAREILQGDMEEAFRQGAAGVHGDAPLVLTRRGWDFELNAIRVPVHSWYGEEDTLVTLAMAKRLAKEIPGCQARFVPNAGHLLTDVPEVMAEIRQVLTS